MVANEVAGRWYLAYGANMLESVFVARRKISPLRQEVASIKSHSLCFNILGVPYSEPALGGLRERGPQDVPVVGIAYFLSQDDFARVIASEGGGIAYKTVQLDAELQRDFSTIPVSTLTGRRQIRHSDERLPSARYMGLLIRGAQEQSLPLSYQAMLAAQPTFCPPRSLRYQFGKWSFDLVWQRVAVWIQKGVAKYKDQTGNVPSWFLLIFDILLWIMWTHHDYIHSLLWGRGDGR